MKMPSEATRAYVYNVLLATTPLLIIFGLANEAEVIAYLGLASATLGLGMARANVTSK